MKHSRSCRVRQPRRRRREAGLRTWSAAHGFRSLSDTAPRKMRLGAFVVPSALWGRRAKGTVIVRLTPMVWRYPCWRDARRTRWKPVFGHGGSLPERDERRSTEHPILDYRQPGDSVSGGEHGPLRGSRRHLPVPALDGHACVATLWLEPAVQRRGRRGSRSLWRRIVGQLGIGRVHALSREITPRPD